MGDLSTTISTALNSPDCAITVGMMMGAIFIVKWLFALWVFIIIAKTVDKLALEPFLEWVKSKIYWRKR